jgi:archaellum component FlaG (FlaF/FlaG flagellin family)
MRKLALVAAMLVFSLVLLANSGESQAASLSISPSSGLPQDEYTAAVSGLSSSTSTIKIQYCKTGLTSACDWSTVLTVSSPSATSGTSQIKFVPNQLRLVDGSPLSAQFKSANKDERFRASIVESGKSQESTTNEASIRFTAMCERGSVSVSFVRSDDSSSDLIRAKIDSDREKTYSIKIRNGDSESCDTGRFEIVAPSKLEERGVTRSSTYTTVSPGAEKTVSVTTELSSDLKTDTSFTLTVYNYDSKVFNENVVASDTIAIKLDMYEDADCDEKDMSVRLDPLSSRDVVPGKNQTFIFYIKNNDDSTCAAEKYDISRFGVATSSKSSSRWFVYTDDKIGTSPRSSVESIRDSDTNQFTYEVYVPETGITGTIKPQEQKTIKINFRPPVDAVTNENDGDNRNIIACVRDSRNSEFCASDFVAIKLPKKSDDTQAPTVVAAPIPENPLPNEGVSIRAFVSDNYRMEKVKFVLKTDEKTEERNVPVTDPDTFVTSESFSYGKGTTVQYRVEAYDWTGVNKACFPSCSTFASFTIDDYPDIYVSSFTVTPSVAKSLGKVTVNIVAKNSGRADASQVNAKIYVGDPSNIIVLGVWDRVSISKGDSQRRTFSREITIPSLSDGEHVMWAEVYSESGEKDRTASNNKKSYKLTIKTEEEQVVGPTTTTTSPEAQSDFKSLCQACIQKHSYGFKSDSQTCLQGTIRGSTDGTSSLEKNNWVWFSADSRKNIWTQIYASPGIYQSEANLELAKKSFTCETPPSGKSSGTASTSGTTTVSTRQTTNLLSACQSCLSRTGHGFKSDTSECLAGTPSKSSDGSGTLSAGNWYWFTTKEKKDSNLDRWISYAPSQGWSQTDVDALRNGLSCDSLSAQGSTDAGSQSAASYEGCVACIRNSINSGYDKNTGACLEAKVDDASIGSFSSESRDGTASSSKGNWVWFTGEASKKLWADYAKSRGFSQPERIENTLSCETAFKTS